MVAKAHPLAEVFGFPTDNFSDEAVRYREKKLCPFNNKVPNCTKDKANDPLGVCSVVADDHLAITCPVRFRQNWIIVDDAAAFFFPANARWTSLTEVRLKDKHGKSAGNIDIVLVSYDEHGKLTDFGALEIQAVYIHGNVRNPFEHYMSNPKANADMNWRDKPNYPGPDYLSSSRKRLAPQLIFKGGILNIWRKKTAVAMDCGFFSTLPVLSEVPKERAEIAWLIYDLVLDKTTNRLVLTKHKTVYTAFDASLDQITRSNGGDVNDFIALLQEKLDEKLNDTPPDTQTVDQML
ncbi:MAG TPA: NotI family restriction endonuclease [Terriglobia bacterium]|nr:NotI family restriction endonuclease [Terriglobia bacterium]